MSQPTVADLVIDALVQSEWTLSERVAALEEQNQQLVNLIADLACDRAGFDGLARKWLGELATSRASAEALRAEIRRYTAARV